MNVRDNDQKFATPNAHLAWDCTSSRARREIACQHRNAHTCMTTLWHVNLFILFFWKKDANELFFGGQLGCCRKTICLLSLNHQYYKLKAWPSTFLHWALLNYKNYTVIQQTVWQYLEICLILLGFMSSGYYSSTKLFQNHQLTLGPKIKSK